MTTKWQELYRSKLTSPEDAAAMIRDYETISSAFGNGQPLGIYGALVNRVLEGKLRYPTLLAASMVTGMPTLNPALENLMEVDSLFVGDERGAIGEGWYTHSPVRFGDLDAISANGLRSVQVSVMRVSPMDKHGFFSTGINVDFGYGMAKSNPDRRLLMVEVNNHVPRTYGNNHLHISEVDVITECDMPLTEVPDPPSRPEWAMIGQYVAEMVPDGATLQLGVGGIPSAVGRALIDKHELGVHSEVIPEVFLDLYQAGVITSTRKTFMPYKWIAAFANGTRRLFDFVHENPLVEMHGCGLVNNPYNIAQNDNMISVNATLQIDLTGQCASEAIGPLQFSSTGGQLDFVQGAWRSKGGKSFICLESSFVDKQGVRRSKIVPELYPNSFVTTPRTDVHWVVTEYGAVLIKGQSLRKRAASLISIAHPDFRDELTFVAKKNKYLR